MLKGGFQNKYLTLLLLSARTLVFVALKLCECRARVSPTLWQPERSRNPPGVDRQKELHLLTYYILLLGFIPSTLSGLKIY